MPHTLLLVDDDENLLHGLARALHSQPYRIYTAQSAEEAKWVFKSRPVDVVLADERMPGESGTDLLAWVAKHYPEVVRIMLAGHPTVETALRAINEAGVCRFFTKPCNVVDLAIAIRRAMEQRDQALAMKI